MMDLGTRVVITVDVATGELVSVKDEAGRCAESFEPSPQNPMALQQLFGVASGGTIFYVKSNPCYAIVNFGGICYRIPVRCP
jgi:hypothetical protein